MVGEKRRIVARHFAQMLAGASIRPASKRQPSYLLRGFNPQQGCVLRSPRFSPQAKTTPLLCCAPKGGKFLLRPRAAPKTIPPLAKGGGISPGEMTGGFDDTASAETRRLAGSRIGVLDQPFPYHSQGAS